MRRLIPVLLATLLIAYGPLTMLSTLDDIERSESARVVPDVHDVPNWRIGDEWVYDTDFDVAGLIQQANVSASINTLDGDTTMEVTDIKFENIQGTQTLVYVVDISGSFSSGNSGANLEGTSGRLDIDYSGTDIVRVSDLATWDSTFTLEVEFAPYNLGFLAVDLATITFSTVYEPPRERYDFPLRTGDQWVSEYYSGTNSSGSSDYFDPAEFDTPYVQDNTTYQVTSDGTPTEDGNTIQYTGCSDSHKVNNWNNTGSAGGFDWYCAAVRSYAWYRIVNPAGFQIDWKLKTYNPTDSSGTQAGSSPGIRNSVIEVEPQFEVILPNATEQVFGHFTVGANDEVGKNLQLRYEIENNIQSLTTDSDGKVSPTIDVGYQRDASNSSDDWTSHGVIIWDPVNKIVGASTIVMDLSVVGIDLVAKPDSMIVTRYRHNESLILSQASGYNALPGDTLHFSVPAQNRGVLTSPATEMEITTPDGTTIRGNLPQLAPYTEARVDVNWTVPENAPIGIQTLAFMVDPDETVTADANRTNNAASLGIFIGRLPVANMTLYDEVFTKENVTIDASASFDQDGGTVTCRFEITEPTADGIRTEIKDDGNCITNHSWSDDGMWEVKLIVIDDELDEVTLLMNATVFNQAPFFINGTIYLDEGYFLDGDLNGPATTPYLNAGTSISYELYAGDNDTISPEGQEITFEWHGMGCEEGLYGPYCTFTPEEEGIHITNLSITDDDGYQRFNTPELWQYVVLNVPPTIGEMRFSIDGIPYESINGTWNIEEDVVATLAIDAFDTISDQDSLIVTWYPSDSNQNLTEDTVGQNSVIQTSWSTSGIHQIRVFATDNDGVTSSNVMGYVNVINVAPELEVLPVQRSIGEDEMLNLTSNANDVADQDDLIYCWDVMSSVDGDQNGIMNDDCDVTGANLLYSWATSGTKMVTANVWDDDGVRDSHNITIRVVNRPPTAVIGEPEGGFVITEGDSITFNGIDSSDTATDRLDLRFIWDDPQTSGALIDGEGEQYTITFKRPGTYIVNLTVTDDDGKSSWAIVSVKVNEKPTEGLFGMSTTAGVSIILAGVIALLVVALLLRRRGDYSDPYGAKGVPEVGGWGSPGLLQQTSEVQPTLTPPMQTDTGPPLPATGLPDGWTMEQWNYYGQQYLDSMQPVQQPVYHEPVTYNPDPALSTQVTEPLPEPVYTPTVQEPAPTPASQALANLLDDLDI
ncbi:MAG: PKD domain-containing protein [Candidatus Poseidoniaceae archaeon]|nr:PKD domain-containing protein [Candidatus Poseidoniaceae archaeon]